MGSTAMMFKALADENRLLLLRLLLRRNCCVRALARQLDISEAAVSQHLKVLREAGLISAKSAVISCTTPSIARRLKNSAASSLAWRFLQSSCPAHRSMAGAAVRNMTNAETRHSRRRSIFCT